MRQNLLMAIAVAVLGGLLGCATAPGPLGDGGERVVREYAQREATAPLPEIPESLNLAAAKDLALAHNPDLAAATWRIEQAAARLQQARTAFFPTVDAVGQWTHQELTPLGMGAANPSEAYDAYRAQLEVSYLVFDGWARQFRTLAARHGREATVAGLAEARRLLALGVAQTFYATLLAGEELRIAEADAQFNAELLDDTRKRMAADKASRLDELNFMVNRNNARIAVLVNRRQREVLRSVLADLMGVANGQLPATTELVLEEAEVPEFEFAAELRQALVKRPDREAIAAQIRAAEANLGAERGSYWPTVTANAHYGAYDTNDGWFGDDDRDVAFGIAAVWRLYDAGLRDARQAEAFARIRELQANLARLDRSIAAELRQNLEQIATARELLTLQDETVKLTLETRDRERQRYKAGQTTLTRLNEVQTNLVRAQANLALRRLALRQEIEELHAARGY